MKIIGICGKKRHGKDTFAQKLKERLEEFDQKVLIHPFAYPLKELVIEMVEQNWHSYGLIETDKALKVDPRIPEPDILNKIIIYLQSYLKKYQYPLLNCAERGSIEANLNQPIKDIYRFLLQYIGTDIIRKRNPEHWVEEMEQYIENIKDSYDILIISDVRFLNEVKLIKKYNGILVKIIRKSLINKDTDKHLSEVEVEKIKTDFNYEIEEGEEHIDKTVSLFLLSSNLIPVEKLLDFDIG